VAPGEYDITCSCNYFECFIDLGPVSVEAAAPTVGITGPQGIPQGGSDVFNITVSGLTDGAVGLTLSTTSNTTGSATFANGATTMTITATQNVTVYGVQASSTANNITLLASFYGEPLTGQQFSVVWVTISLQSSKAPLQKDAELQQFLALVGGSGAAQGGLGAEIYYNGSEDPFECAVGIELVGTVTPSNYAGLVSISKSIVGSAVFDGQNPDTTGLARPPGPDNIAASLEDNVVGAGSAGQVFDLDAPGVGAVSTSGNAERFRTNFQAYAILGDFGTSSPQASASFPYSVAVSCGGTLDAPALDTTYVVNGDNAAATGTINLTYNLKPAGQ
jgi:hypothetical protein